MRRVYLDNAATTPTDPRVLEAMQPYFTEIFGNPSSIYLEGREARKAVDLARTQVADALGASPDEIILLSGGTEADNLALTGVARAPGVKGKHIITSAVEHHAVLETCHQLEKDGCEVTYVPVDSYGLVDPEEVRKALRPDTILVSVMHANNEIGTIQPIREISRIAKEAGVLMHTDAVQTVGALSTDVKELGVDLLSVSSHKLYGPKGVGCLFTRKGVRLRPLLQGGAQERKRRAGTENVPGIIGFGKAMELAGAEREERANRITGLRDELIQGLLAAIPEVSLNGHPELRLPNNVNIAIKYVEGESICLNLDFAGIAASSGSACSSDSLEPSHVLLAIGISPENAHGSLRFSLGKSTTSEDITYVVEQLPPIIEKLRAMSPLYHGSA
ncbi:MAG: cysteine desulfurase NifS [Actinobacteria bacterium]|nr:cysteine desulfurase NifS [Actinomycetota bacterium]